MIRAWYLTVKGAGADASPAESPPAAGDEEAAAAIGLRISRFAAAILAGRRDGVRSRKREERSCLPQIRFPPPQTEPMDRGAVGVMKEAAAGDCRRRKRPEIPLPVPDMNPIKAILRGG